MMCFPLSASCLLWGEKATGWINLLRQDSLLPSSKSHGLIWVKVEELSRTLWEKLAIPVCWTINRLVYGWLVPVSYWQVISTDLTIVSMIAVWKWKLQTYKTKQETKKIYTELVGSPHITQIMVQKWMRSGDYKNSKRAGHLVCKCFYIASVLSW